GGEPPAVTAPLEQVQIDHTVIDLIVVDDRDRQPIGRPYLTLAIDVFIDRNLKPKKIKKTPKNGCLFNTACVP
ncbi:transposase, partial [Escherichia coli]